MTLLRKASYNNVPFEVTAGSITVGRRNAIHEFPQRDTPFCEDLGRAYRQFNLTGFVTGSDYIQKAKRLQDALESDTKGRLVHPWLGTLDVVVADKTTISWDTSGRLATFDISFIELGEQKDPSIGQSFISELKNLADELSDEAYNIFVETMNKLDYFAITDSIISNSWTTISEKLKLSDLCRTFSLEDLIDYEDETAAVTLGSDPAEFATSIQNLLYVGAESDDTHNWRNVIKSTCALASSLPFKKHGLSNTLGKSNNAIKQLCKLTLIADVIGAVSLVATDVDVNDDATEVATAQCYDEIVEVRDTAMALLESEMIATETDDNNLYQTLESAYATVYKQLTNKVLDAANLYTKEVKLFTPAVCLSYDTYEGAERADEIVQRNKIINPLFAYGSIRMLNK